MAVSRPVKFTLAVLISVIIALTAAAVATLPSRLDAPTDELSVHFIDVGQGDAILLDLGATEVLIDGGERQVSGELVSYLRRYVDGPLEVMIATHPHADHIGALPAMLAAFAVEAIWDNGESAASNTYADYRAAALAEGAVMNSGRAGGIIAAGSLVLHVLSPTAVGNDTNDNSLVLLLTYGAVDFIFMADAEEGVEHDLLAAFSLPDVDILKVGHHASRTASSPLFLATVRPEVAVYSAAAGNSYGHPHPEAVQRLEAAGAAIYGTDVNGSVIVTSDGKTYSLSVGKGAVLS